MHASGAPKGYLAEKMLVAADPTAVRNVVTGAAVRPATRRASRATPG
jgi:hypothetical protein